MARPPLLRKEGNPFSICYSLFRARQHALAPEATFLRLSAAWSLDIFPDVVTRMSAFTSQFCTSLCERSCTRNVSLNSPPRLGGVAAPSIKCREASFEGAAGVVNFGTVLRECLCETFVETDHPVCAFKGGFAKFYYSRSLPSCSRRGTPSPDDLRSTKKLCQKNKVLHSCCPKKDRNKNP